LCGDLTPRSAQGSVSPGLRARAKTSVDESSSAQIDSSNGADVVSKKGSSYPQDTATPKALSKSPPETFSETKIEITSGGRRRSRWGPIHGAHKDNFNTSGEVNKQKTAQDGGDNLCTAVNEGQVINDVDNKNVRSQYANSAEKESVSSGLKCADRSISQEKSCQTLAKDSQRTTQSKDCNGPSPNDERRAAKQDDGFEQKPRRLGSKEEIKKELGNCAMLETGRQELEKNSSKVEINTSPEVAVTFPDAADAAKLKSTLQRITGPKNSACTIETFPDAADAPNPQSTVARITKPNNTLAGVTDTLRQVNFHGELCNKGPCETVESTSNLGHEIVNPLQNEMSDCTHRVALGSVLLIESSQNLTKMSSLSDNSSLSESSRSIQGKSNTGVVENIPMADTQPTKV
jgi:hypothetical protein